MITGRMAILAAGCVLAAMPAAGQDSRATARELAKQHESAVIWVTAVVKVEITGSGRSLGSREMKIQALGTVIDESGLTVTAFSAVDPCPAAQAMLRRNGTADAVVKSEHTEVKLSIGDQEIPARIVLTDPDLDLAFVIPEAADAKLVVMPLKLTEAPKLELLDDLVCLGRLPKGLNQTPAVTMSEVTAIIRKPRPFFMSGKTLGGPVFSMDGTVVGITVAYHPDPDNPSSTGLVIVPAEDVVKVAKEALARREESAPEPCSNPAQTRPAATTKPATAQAAATQPVE